MHAVQGGGHDGVFGTHGQASLTSGALGAADDGFQVADRPASAPARHSPFGSVFDNVPVPRGTPSKSCGGTPQGNSPHDPWSEEGQLHIRDLSAALGILDVKDCVHRMVIPEWLSTFFCMDAVRAKDVNLVGMVIDGKVLDPLDEIYPCPRCLPRGFSWAFFFAQRYNEW